MNTIESYPKEKLEAVRQLRELTGHSMIDCQKALRRNKWDMNMAVKDLEHYPIYSSNIADYWRSKQYLFCEHCDRFYIVKRGSTHCDICGNALRPEEWAVKIEF